MSNLEIFSRKTVLVGFLVLLFLGAFSHAVATAEVDPGDLIGFSTFLGGTGDERMEETSYTFGSPVVDSKGNIIVVGRTASADFPLKDAYQDHINGFSDGIISKFSSNGSLLFSTYLGGSAQELITDVAIDSNDNIIVAGITGSSDFPLMNPFQLNFTGGNEGNADCFITKFSEDGQSLLFSTFFGGTASDWCYTMNVDSNDRIAISGTTESTDFPLLNPHQDNNSGLLDVFLSLFEADGQSLLFSTYLGTAGIDHGRRVAFDSQGDVLLAGMAEAGGLATEGVYQEEHAGGSSDAFIAKFKTNGTLVYLTYVGGALAEWGCDLAVDSEDNIVITGFTASHDFPTVNTYQDEWTGEVDTFITKMTPDGRSVVFSTYLGGVASDYGNAIATDSHDRIIVVGQTDSADFPTTIPIHTTESYYNNVSLTVFNEDGSLLFSMMFGGGHNDIGIGVAWHSDDSFIILGHTGSDDFPVHEAYQERFGGDYDIFVMKLDLAGLIDIPQAGFTFGLVEGSIVVGVVAVLVLLLFIRKRAG
ncbi:MAG: SBBP repeat-containing protein [Candidatus Thorarchaeota archaeon]